MRVIHLRNDVTSCLIFIYLFFFICKQATGDGQEMVEGGGDGGFLPVVSWGISKLPSNSQSHIGSVVSAFLSEKHQRQSTL